MGLKKSKKDIKAQMPVDEDLDIYVRAALGRKATRVSVLDLRGISPVADYFIICGAKSTRQADAITDHILSELRMAGKKALSVDGQGEAQWILMDYGFIMIHVFYEPVRDFYDLEGLWMDAPRVITPAMTEAEAKGDEGVKIEEGDDGDDW